MSGSAGWTLRLAGLVVAALMAAAPARANEMLIYDWNRPVTTAERGFPRDFPPKENGNWTQPINFAEGTYYLRMQIRSQPVAQHMRPQFCVWQDGSTPMREMCTPTVTVHGNPDTVLTWAVPIADTRLSRKQPVDWTKPRRTNGVAIKDERGYPISDYGQPPWNWFGEDPADWYPLDMRFTVVVVAKGATFGGWTRYLNATPVTEQREAEDTVIRQASVGANYTGYSGAGFVDYFDAPGGYIVFLTNAARAQTGKLSFRYANGGSVNRPLEITVNGTVINPALGFASTGAWTNWKMQTLNAPLLAGTNIVRARATGTTGGPNVDRLDVTTLP